MTYHETNPTFWILLDFINLISCKFHDTAKYHELVLSQNSETGCGIGKLFMCKLLNFRGVISRCVDRIWKVPKNCGVLWANKKRLVIFVANLPQGHPHHNLILRIIIFILTVNIISLSCTILMLHHPCHPAHHRHP